MDIRKLFRSKLFLASAIVVLVLAGYSVYNDVSYSVKQFYATGSELFTAVPADSDDVLKVSDVLSTLSSERKNSPTDGANALLAMYLIVVSIVAIWRATKGMAKKGKKVVLRIVSFILGPIIGVVGMLGLVFLPSLGVYGLAQFVILRQADAATQGLVEQLKSEKERSKLGIITDEAAIIERVKDNPVAPVIINDDDFFTSNVVIAVATTGRNKTAFDAVAIPQAVFRKSEGNALMRDMDADVLLLPGHVLAVRSLTPDFGKRLLPMLGEKIIRQNKLMNAKIAESGKRPPQYTFLSADDYRKLRDKQAEKDLRRYIDTINLIKRWIAEGSGSAANLREWEEAYQNYLENPVGTFAELGTATSNSVQVLLIDEENIPSDLPGSVRYFLSPLTTTVHELLHYYSNDKEELPDSLEESITSYYEKTLTQGIKILHDSKLSLDDFVGYPQVRPVIEKMREDMGEVDLAQVYFSGNQVRFARVFEQKYEISYEDFTNGLDMIFYAFSAEEGERLKEELIEKLKK